jgi:DNA-binding transcriptional ArsR family regulator
MTASPLPTNLPSRQSPAAAVAQLQHRSHEAAALLKALANADRLLLLCHLLDAEHTVAELGAITGIVQPTLSQQLGVLRNEDLVATRREGKFIHYRVASPAVRAVLRTLYRLYCAAGAAPVH